MHLLDSRASRMSHNEALLTLHADYIDGEHANYRKWYFAAQLDLDDAVGHVQNPGLQRLKSTKRKRCNANEKSLQMVMDCWRQAMNDMTHYNRLRQIALYLVWGEAAQIQFVPEFLCFIFKCADIIGYDGVNQLFWYLEGIARIVLVDKVRQIIFLILCISDDAH